jgi:acyl transferase domain-containing protein/acyl carrier protein
MTETDYASAVALIGMSGRFPGASSVGALWDNLTAGLKGLRELTDEELSAAGADPGMLADPSYVRIGGPLADIDQFDATVFGISPRESAAMDPQHRLFLECAWEALEGGGYCPTATPGNVGVFAGCGFPDYIVQNIQHLFAEPGGVLLIAVGNERDSLASFVSYKLGLTGPSIGVQTFCSTSMIAVHLACQSLLTYECDIALAGGAFIPLPQPAGYRYEPGGIASPDGRVRSFDAEANGTVMGSGVGAVALKRMSEAVADGDVIHAVILGSATNNDGRVRAGYTAPGVDGQAEVIELALGVAGVKPETVGYVECHATGTALGDSIELAAMARVFTQSRENPCVLSTLKPSLGHLDRASGVAGLMHAALVLKHEVLPATPNYRSPNPALAAAQDQFTVLSEHRPWPAGPTPRRAGVNSFGLGGTNAHVVLEQAPARPQRPGRPGPHLLAFSAANDAALTEMTERLRQHLTGHPGDDLADVAFTLQVSRGGFALRRAIVCRDAGDAVAALADPARWLDHKTRRRTAKVRIVAPDTEVPAYWWPQLHAAIGALTATQASGTGQVPSAVGRDDALGALAAWLTRLGVHPLRDEAVPPAESAAVQTGAEAAGPPGGGTAVQAGAEEVVVAPGQAGSAGEWLLAMLAQLWQAGCPIDWAALHRGEGRRVELPTYPFQRRRYWVDPKPKASNGPDMWFSAPETAGRTFDRSQWTYLPTWQLRPCPVADLDEQVRQAGPWLVFIDDDRGEALARQLLRSGADVTVVRPGERFERHETGDFTIGIAAADDINRLLSRLPASPRAIVHGFSLGGAQAGPAADPVAHFDAEQERGFYSVLALAAGLVDETGVAPRAELVLLTSGAVGVVGSDLRHPEHSTLAALPPSLAQENPRLRCRHIDVDPAFAGHTAALTTATSQLMAAALSPYEGPMAVRAGELWLRRYQPFPTQEPSDGHGPIRHGDTVLITGGLGDIGLVLSRHLATRYGCKLVLTARSELPPRVEWQQFLDRVPVGGERAARHLANILDLEKLGAEVLAMSADAADPAQMRAVIAAANERFGEIDVAVHAAGVQDARYFNYAHLVDHATCEAHFAAKVTGFHVLQEVLGDQCAGRRITFSSLAAVLGGMTLAPYAAANAALDAYARLARMSGAGGWISVDWDTWSIDPDRLIGHGPGVTDYAMAPAEALDIFERALGSGDRVGHLVISTGSLAARIQLWVTDDIHDGDAQDGDDRERYPRPDLSTPYVAAAEGTETIVAEIWSTVLGIEPIGVLDNFFELGGHSLIAINLTARLRKSLGVAIPITALLENATIRTLAELIDSGESARSGQLASLDGNGAAEPETDDTATARLPDLMEVVSMKKIIDSDSEATP